MDQISGAWIVAGIVSIFLIVCGEYNHRTGYKKVRAAESPIEAAILWLTALRNSLSAPPREAAVLRPELNREVYPGLPGGPLQFDTDQLIRLDAALRATESTTPAATIVPEKELVGARV